jgi:hypothetical protein
VGTALEHVMVVGGTPKEWDSVTRHEWIELARRLGEAAAGAGARWVTLRPYGPESGGDADGGSARWSQTTDDSRCTVIVDASADGRTAFAAAAASVPAGNVIDERAIAAALYAPADVEPDLILIVGPHHRLPPSLVWELAYGELVFVDLPSFTDLTDADLSGAIDTFNGRNRRFGGI